jgi:hypothetical protein
MGLYAFVKRGKNRGIIVTPHKYEDGKYRVARRKEDIHIAVDQNELKPAIARGLGIRMGNKQAGHSPGLFMPKSILGR